MHFCKGYEYAHALLYFLHKLQDQKTQMSPPPTLQSGTLTRMNQIMYWSETDYTRMTWNVLVLDH